MPCYLKPILALVRLLVCNTYIKWPYCCSLPLPFSRLGKASSVQGSTQYFNSELPNKLRINSLKTKHEEVTCQIKWTMASTKDSMKKIEYSVLDDIGRHLHTLPFTFIPFQFVYSSPQIN